MGLLAGVIIVALGCCAYVLWNLREPAKKKRTRKKPTQK